jgi:hypothetical protein
MLQLALWVGWVANSQGWRFPQASIERLRAATQWLANLLDRESGQVPNLGPNDGACILSLSASSFSDYRPVVQAAFEKFLGKRPLQAGVWDEMVCWLDGSRAQSTAVDQLGGAVDHGTIGCAPEVLRTQHSWGYLRAAQFDSRPGHADQLHLDLWWRGRNVALDAGSYLYNAAPPWNNALARTAAHNTVMVNGLEQMLPAGRFLWLDWAQASALRHERAEDGAWMRLVAEHDGYRHIGVLHRRSVTSYRDDHWLVVDSLQPDPARRQAAQEKYLFRLHWLLPDLPWNLNEQQGEARLELTCQSGQIILRVQAEEGGSESGWLWLSLVRAGVLVQGTILNAQERDLQLSGWYSPTYAHKVPALSFSIEVLSKLPLRLDSEWRFIE